ncbi:hypothetical protein HPC49_21955 [Pyxidicoccus fallax]|uniref:Uncharacterized protein n=1 Tax=Pyxidicoccus fallax TaxID=394095 RepID=A0A848LQT0_9BACT|nr:DUF6086 family protein [Pyxidicoccus fallax]NMO20002.1 hypothetical protein [Pyxidicoccus fallax]NPC80877.1 hypothetical protein [Pyxidicoccus fallax]
MSIYFMTPNKRDVWNPASVTGRLFCEQVESVARLLDVESGLGAVVSDEVVVNDEKFVSFVQSFAERLLRTSAESGAYLLLEGCFSIAGALAVKLGARLPDDDTIATLVSEGRRIVG